MQHKPKWAAGMAIVAAMVGAASVTVAFMLPSDQELASWLTAQARDRLGVALSIESVHWEILPRPVLVVNGLRTQEAQPVTIQQLKAYPGLRMLLDRRLVLERIDIDTAVLPLHSVRALEAALAPGGAGGIALVPPEHLTFRNLVWVSYGGIAVTYDGAIAFGPHWRPQHAELVRPGFTPTAAMALTREAQTDRWQVRIQVGGGTAHGELETKQGEDGAMQLNGHLTPRDIDVVSALVSFNRRAPVAGKASGQTVVSANGKSAGELLRSLHTQTRFSVNPATLLRFDLNQAISTGGKSHVGRTDLQTLTGRMDTQNGYQGMRVMVTDMKAKTATFTVTGKGTLYHGQVEASGKLDLLAGAVGVPFNLSGPLDTPEVSVPPGFFAGAALGTAVLPGIGTVIGARIGSALGGLFHSDEKPSAAPKKGAMKH